MPKPATLLKKRLALVFSSEFCEIFKNTFFTEHLWTTASVLSHTHLDTHVHFLLILVIFGITLVFFRQFVFVPQALSRIKFF